MTKKNSLVWPTIKGIKKMTYCKYCGVKINVSNFNQMLCKRCGYRDKAARRKK